MDVGTDEVDRAGWTGWRLATACCLTGALIATVCPASFAADSVGYFAYLPSLLLDRDLDFGDEYAGLGWPAPPPSPTGVSFSPYAIGPALAWLPFYLAIHVACVIGEALGLTGAAADGIGALHFQSTRWGTATILCWAATELARAFARDLGAVPARFGVAAALMCSPTLFYAAIQGAMAHGLAAGWAALSVAFGLRSLRDPNGFAALACGFSLGMLAITRWQSLPFAVWALVVIAAAGASRGRIAARLIPAGLALVLLQMAVWKVQYDEWLWRPRHYDERAVRWFDVPSAHWFDVLWGARGGLFAWHPLLLVALVGLLISFRRRPWTALSGVAIFLGTWMMIAPSIDWHGSDTFGGRRFDLMFPFFAWGFGVVARGALARPSALLGTALACGFVWNAGLAILKHQRQIESPAPIERMAVAQVRLWSRMTGEVAGLAGDAGHDLWYRLFYGEFIYSTMNPSGYIAVSDPASPYLAGGFLPPENRNGEPQFRWVERRACLRLPLERRADDLRASVSLRTPARIDSQNFTVVVNGRKVMNAVATRDWSDQTVVLPSTALRSGLNFVCFEFERTALHRGRQVAAAIRHVQLP